MGMHTEAAEARVLSMSVLPGEEIESLYGGTGEYKDINQALVLEDTANCLAFVLEGSDDDLEALALDILTRIKRRPMALDGPN